MRSEVRGEAWEAVSEGRIQLLALKLGICRPIINLSLL